MFVTRGRSCELISRLSDDQIKRRFCARARAHRRVMQRTAVASARTVSIVEMQKALLNVKTSVGPYFQKTFFFGNNSFAVGCQARAPSVKDTFRIVSGFQAFSARMRDGLAGKNNSFTHIRFFPGLKRKKK